MTRSSSYKKQVISKLLSSKFIYPKTPNLQPIKRLTIKGTIKAQNPEVGASSNAILFGRLPAFTRSLYHREKEYRLIHLTITSTKRNIVEDLDRLAATIIPFQLENYPVPVTAETDIETS